MLSTILFWIIGAALLTCHLIVAWHSLVTWRFWEDEAFNLTVPLNLLAGLGYASDGALSGSTITPFDARISTGPSVLLPVAGVLATGIDPVIGSRLIPLAYWMLLLTGLGIIGYRVAGRWGALVAVAVPLAFNSTVGVSPIQGPADLLGEIPAAALLVWALLLLPRRAWVAGLLVGLAVQAKLIALLALPAFAVAMWVLARHRGAEVLGGWRRIGETLRIGWLPLILVGVPTLLFEAWAFVTLGASGYRDHLRGLRDFLLSGGQSTEPTTIPQKLGTLFDSWFVPSWIAAACSGVVLVAVVAALVLHGRASRFVLMIGLAGLFGAAAFIAWWANASHTPLWVRHPAVGIFAFVPLIAIVAIWAVREFWSADIARRGLAALTVGILAVSLGYGIAQRITQQFEPRSLTLASQRASVAPIAEWVESTGTEWLAAEPWGAAIAPIVMSGAHVGLFDAPAMDGVPRLTGYECQTKTLVDTRFYRVCAAP